jgi:hypothetical protein
VIPEQPWVHLQGFCTVNGLAEVAYDLRPLAARRSVPSSRTKEARAARDIEMPAHAARPAGVDRASASPFLLGAAVLARRIPRGADEIPTRRGPRPPVANTTPAPGEQRARASREHRIARSSPTITPGEPEEPAVAQTKQRLSRVVEDRLADPGNAEMRKLARAAIEAAQAVKHNATPDRLSAGLAADAVILVANLLRRLSDP